VSLLGQDVTLLPLFQRARRKLSYVPQTPSVLWDLTVRDNLDTFFRMANRSRAGVVEHAKKLGLMERLDVRARALSGGERRRLELLRALVPEPEVLVCDEPLTGLDPAGIKEVGTLFRALKDNGTLVVFADHRIGDVLPFCDQALLLADGQILHRGAAAEFADHPAVRERYLT
jgi:lipopolysaccharide export system ATP-binding protein